MSEGLRTRVMGPWACPRVRATTGRFSRVRVSIRCRIGMDDLAEKPIYSDDIYLERRYMIEALSLDQLRTFIAAAETGSFSAAGRKLRRAQSVVSQSLANLEAQLGVKLFDRTARYPTLTEHGRSLLHDARGVADGIDDFKARAKAMRE